MCQKWELFKMLKSIYYSASIEIPEADFGKDVKEV